MDVTVMSQDDVTMRPPFSVNDIDVISAENQRTHTHVYTQRLSMISRDEFATNNYTHQIRLPIEPRANTA